MNYYMNVQKEKRELLLATKRLISNFIFKNSIPYSKSLLHF